MNGPNSGKSVKSRHSRAYAGLFLIFLACGLVAGLPIGRAVFRSSQPHNDQTVQNQGSLAQPATGQNSWLVIGVDDLQAAAPGLRSTWLVLFFPGQSAVTLLPVFPVPGAAGLGEAFSLDRQGSPSASFLEALQEKRLWWNGYLILDAAGLNELVGYLEVQRSGTAQDPFQTGSSQGAQGYSENAANQRDQAVLLENACQQANDAFNPAEIIQLAADLSPHLRTDLDLRQVARAWPLTAAGRLKVDCEFPVLAVSR